MRIERAAERDAHAVPQRRDARALAVENADARLAQRLGDRARADVGVVIAEHGEDGNARGELSKPRRDFARFHGGRAGMPLREVAEQQHGVGIRRRDRLDDPFRAGFVARREVKIARDGEQRALVRPRPGRDGNAQPRLRQTVRLDEDAPARDRRAGQRASGTEGDEAPFRVSENHALQ